MIYMLSMLSVLLPSGAISAPDGRRSFVIAPVPLLGVRKATAFMIGHKMPPQSDMLATRGEKEKGKRATVSFFFSAQMDRMLSRAGRGQRGCFLGPTRLRNLIGFPLNAIIEWINRLYSRSRLSKAKNTAHTINIFSRFL